MAAANAFLTQVSHRAWKCSECALVFVSDESLTLDRLLDRFVKHARRAHCEADVGDGPKRVGRRRRLRRPPPPEGEA